MSIGPIEGGTSVNTVPDRCKAEVDRRVIPGEDPRKLSGELLHVVNDTMQPRNVSLWLKRPPNG